MGRVVAIADRRQAGRGAVERQRPAGWKPVPELGYWERWGPRMEELRRRGLGARAGHADRRRGGAGGDALAERDRRHGPDVRQRRRRSAAAATPATPAQLSACRRACCTPATTRSWSMSATSGARAASPGPPTRSMLTLRRRPRRKPLGSGWQYVAHRQFGRPAAGRRRGQGSSGVSTIYNAMVAPLGPLGLKGVAWYQGEADVGQAGLRSPPGGVDGELARAVPRSRPAVPDRRPRRLGQAASRSRSKAAGRR